MTPIGDEITTVLSDRQRLRRTGIGYGIPFFATPYGLNFRYLLSTSTKEFFDAAWRRNTGDGGRPVENEASTLGPTDGVTASDSIYSGLGSGGGNDDQ